MEINNRLIIVEGPDRVGKTTFINYLYGMLKSYYDIKLMKFDGPKSTDESDAYKEQKDKFFNSFDEAKAWLAGINNHVVIMDRSYVGEFVYSQIYNRLQPYYICELHNKFVKELNPLYIHIDGVPIINETATAQDKILAGRHKDVQILFNDFFTSLAPLKVLYINNHNFKTFDARNIFIYNTILRDSIIPDDVNIYGATKHKPQLSKINPKIINHPFWANQLSISLYKHNPVICPQAPDIFNFAMFGEAPGYLGCGYTHIPFYYDKSGMLIRNAFWKFGYNLDDMFISNIFHSTPPNNKLYDFFTSDNIDIVNFNKLDNKLLPDWVNFEMELFANDVKYALGQTKKFIAVGTTANRLLQKIDQDKHLDLQITHIKHPAYYLYKRMENEMIKEYKEILSKNMVLL